jgi:dihydropteroate synthase
MISLRELARLAAEHADDLDRPVAPVRIGGRTYDTDRHPVLMGVVNLSRDSNYRESIAVSTESAVRKGRVLAAHGAGLVDIGAESSRATAVAVDVEGQKRLLLPVVEALANDGIAVSVESYEASVVKAGLEAGACVVNLTGQYS